MIKLPNFLSADYTFMKIHNVMSTECTCKITKILNLKNQKSLNQPNAKITQPNKVIIIKFVISGMTFIMIHVL